MSSHSLSLPHSQPGPVAGTRGVRRLHDARLWFLLLFVYFALHAVVRVLISPCVELDEAEQVVFSQVFTWSYGSSLPLYTWLQIPAFVMFGQSVLGLTVLKNAILFGLVAFSYITARSISGSHLVGVVASSCALLTPQIAWESQRDLTHSVLASTLVLAWLACLEQVRKKKSWSWYAALGFVTAAGGLSKFNFMLFVAASLAAAFTVPSFRNVVLNRRMLLASGIVTGVGLCWWLGYQQEGAHLHHAASRLGLGEKSSWMRTGAAGLWNVVVAVLGSCSIPAVVLAVVTRRKPRREVSSQTGDWLRLFARGWLLMGLLIVLAIPSFGVHGFHQRWLQPLLVGFPVFAAVAWSSQIDDRVAMRLAGLAIAVMLTVAVVLPSRTIFGWGKDEPYLRPYPALAHELRSRLPSGVFLITDTTLLGGNLRMALQDIPVVTPELAHLAAVRREHCVAVWDLARAEQAPERLVTWAASEPRAAGVRWQPQVISAPYASNRAKQRTLAFVQLW